MNNATDTLLRSVGQIVWEIRIMAEAAGDTLLDTPTLVTKKVRVYGVFRLATVELLEQIGTSLQGDAVFFVRSQIDMKSQLEFEDKVYELTEEIVQRPLHAGKGYTYILHRLQAMS